MNRDKLIRRLKRGWLSSAQAFLAFGTLKLTTRLSEMRKDGYAIESRWVAKGGKRWREYRMGR